MNNDITLFIYINSRFNDKININENKKLIELKNEIAKKLNISNQFYFVHNFSEYDYNSKKQLNIIPNDKENSLKIKDIHQYNKIYIYTNN